MRLVRVGCRIDVRRRKDGENERLDECDQALHGIHKNQKHEPCNRRQARNEVHGASEQRLLDEASGCDAEDGEHHMAGEHIAVKSNCKRKHCLLYTSDAADD